MTDSNGKPRHLNDITSIMPSVRAPRHAAPDTNEIPAQMPPREPQQYPHPPIPVRTRSEDRKAKKAGWFRRVFLGE